MGPFSNCEEALLRGGHREPNMKQVLGTDESHLAAPPLPFPKGSPGVGRTPGSRSWPGPEAEFAGPGPGAGQSLLPPGGWASPSRVPRAWAAVHPGGAALTAQLLRPQEWLPKPTHRSTQRVLHRLQTPAPRPVPSSGAPEPQSLRNTQPARQRSHTVAPTPRGAKSVLRENS